MSEQQYCMGCMEALPESGECSHCSFRENEYENKLGSQKSTLLPLGTRLADERYIIGRVLGFGGFSITYLALDLRTKTKVAIKEYMPRALCHRSPEGNTVEPYGDEDGMSFEYGLEQFLKEARILGHFNQHKGMVAVHNYFYAHGTGYLVMDYLEGATLKEYMNELGRPMSWEEALVFIMPVAEILEGLHTSGLIHRDISPDNIFVDYRGEMKLFDFGAARLALGEYTKSLPVVLKAGFTPLEQYSGKGNQGPWTDLYALAATIYRLVAGKQLQAATDRVANDLVPGMVYEQAGIPASMKPILLKAVALKPEARYQTIGEFRRDISLGRISEPGEFELDEESIAAQIREGKLAGADDDGYEFVGGVMRKKTATAVDHVYLEDQNEVLNKEYYEYLKSVRRKRFFLAMALGIGVLGGCAFYVLYRIFPEKFAFLLTIMKW